MDDEPIDITGANVSEEKRYIIAELPVEGVYVKTVLVPKYVRQFYQLHLDPEDLEQELWLKVLKSRHLLNDVAHPKSWTGTTILNLCRNQHRDTKRERESTEPLELKDGRIREIAAPEPTACDDTTDDLEKPELTEDQKSEIRRKVLRILEKLPPKERKVVRWRLETVPVAVIAKEIQRSSKTVHRLAKQKKPIWKKIVKELGVDPKLLKDPLAKAALTRFVAISLREEHGSHRAPHA